MIHLAWMLLLFSAAPDCLSDALPDCILQVPVTVTVSFTDPVEHEDLHGRHSTLRQTYGKPTVYVGGGRAAVVGEPDIRLSAVADAVATRHRGPVYDLYLVQAQRWWERQPTYILDESFSYLAGTGFYISKGRTSDAVYSAARARELSRYCTVLLRLARRLPGYDARQLEAIVEYQWKRVGSLPGAEHPAMQTRSIPAAGERSSTVQRRVVWSDSSRPTNPSSAVESAPQQPRSLQGDGSSTAKNPSSAASAPIGQQGAQRRHATADADIWVIAWTASWCGPCQLLKPLYDRLRARGVTVYELDVNNPPADWAHLRPATVPQVRLYRGKKRVGLWSGASEAVIQAIEQEAVK